MCCLIEAPLTSNFGFLRLLFALFSFCAVGCSPSSTEISDAGSQSRSDVKELPLLVRCVHSASSSPGVFCNDSYISLNLHLVGYKNVQCEPILQSPVPGQSAAGSGGAAGAEGEGTSRHPDPGFDQEISLSMSSAEGDKVFEILSSTLCSYLERCA